MLTITIIFVLLLNIVGFLSAYSLKTDKLTDVFYVLSFVGITLIGLLFYSPTIVQWVIALTVFIWATRLGSYLYKRINMIGHDSRFDKIRDDFWKFGGFWLLQAVSAWLIMLPVILIFNSKIITVTGTTMWIGFGVSIAGILIETVSDKQKYKFLTTESNKGKWVDVGLWKYSRHPNYFGEIVMWLGVYLMSAQWLGKPEIYFATLGPLTIAFLILFVSGVPVLEKRADKKFGKNKSYIAYRDNTSVLIPLPKKTNQ